MTSLKLRGSTSTFPLVFTSARHYHDNLYCRDAVYLRRFVMLSTMKGRRQAAVENVTTVLHDIVRVVPAVFRLRIRNEHSTREGPRRRLRHAKSWFWRPHEPTSQLSTTDEDEEEEDDFDSAESSLDTCDFYTCLTSDIPDLAELDSFPEAQEHTQEPEGDKLLPKGIENYVISL